MHGLCDYFLKLEYMKRLCLLGFSHSVCSKEVHDMFCLFMYSVKQKTKSRCLAFDMTLSYQCSPANKHFLCPLPADT